MRAALIAFICKSEKIRRDSTYTPRKAVYFLCRVLLRLEHLRDVIKTT